MRSVSFAPPIGTLRSPKLLGWIARECSVQLCCWCSARYLWRYQCDFDARADGMMSQGHSTTLSPVMISLPSFFVATSTVIGKLNAGSFSMCGFEDFFLLVRMYTVQHCSAAQYAASMHSQASARQFPIAGVSHAHASLDKPFCVLKKKRAVKFTIATFWTASPHVCSLANHRMSVMRDTRRVQTRCFCVCARRCSVCKKKNLWS